MIEVKIPSSPYSKQLVTLGDDAYTIYFKYNIRNASWYLTLKDSEDENTILGGIKLMPNQDLLSRYIVEGKPLGKLLLLRTKNTPEGITQNNLGVNKDYGLFWVSPDDIEELNISDSNIQL